MYIRIAVIAESFLESKFQAVPDKGGGGKSQRDAAGTHEGMHAMKTNRGLVYLRDRRQKILNIDFRCT